MPATKSKPEPTTDPAELQRRALAAVPGWTATETALAELDAARRAVTGTANRAASMDGLVTAVARDLAAGRGVPDDLADRAWQAGRAGEVQAAQLETLRQVRDRLVADRDAALVEHIEDAFDVLRAELAAVVERAFAAVAALGDVRTADDVLEAGPGAGDALDALRFARELGARYAGVRQAQAVLVGRCALAEGYRSDQRNESDRAAWGGLTPAAAAHEHGHWTDPGCAGLDVADPVELLVALVDVLDRNEDEQETDPIGAVVVPYAEVRQRAADARVGPRDHGDQRSGVRWVGPRVTA